MQSIGMTWSLVKINFSSNLIGASSFRVLQLNYTWREAMLKQQILKWSFGSLAMLSAVLIWSVGALAEPPMGIQGNVTVTNTPLPVVVQAAAWTPVQISESNQSCPVSACQVDLLTVPSGKRLVVEYFTATTTITPVATPGVSAEVRLRTKFDGQFQSITVGITENTGPGSNSKDIFGGVVKLYAEPETVVGCSLITPDFQGFFFLRCSITGYLEDVPE
jgi:hypothetical protein